MAQVNVDLSEYDMLRDAKAKAESQVKELSEEVKKLKDNASNVVVKNRYYIPSLNYKAGATNLLRNLGVAGIRHIFNSYDYSGNLTAPQVEWLTSIIENSLSDIINFRSAYRLDAEIAEIRGFDELQSQIQDKLEKDIKENLIKEQEELDIAKQAYDAKKLDIDRAVTEAKEILTSHYEELLKISHEEKEKLKKELKEASKSSEEKLADALAKLEEAKAEVAKYQVSRKSLFKRLFKQ